MPLIWCSISGHGFGHAAQVVPVLNELGRQVAGVKAILRTSVPRWFFESQLDVEWELSPAEQDIGCVQQGPLKIDVRATWAEHKRFHMDWERRLHEEMYAIQSRAPDLVLSDISHLAIEAGRRAGISTIGLCSLSWDQVLAYFLVPDQNGPPLLLQKISQSYGMADLMIRPSPGIALPAFRKIVDIGPIAGPIVQDKLGLRRAVNADPDERIVVVGFGGIPLESLPFHRLSQMNGYCFVVWGPSFANHGRVISASSIPLPFRTLLASADILITKPGYSTIVEAVASRTPVIYVRRYNFADEDSLVSYLHRYGRGIELLEAAFHAGHWEQALQAVLKVPEPHEPPPSPTGATDAAKILASYL